MRLGLIVAGVAILATAGCSSSDKSAGQDQRPTSQPDGAGASVRMSADPVWVDPTDFPGRVHVVQQGDTLFSLAERYYGNGNQWRKILQANQRRLTNPRDLPVGMKLIIP